LLSTDVGSNLDLKSLLEDLKEVKNWFQLGLWLGIEHDTLKIIEENHRHDNERCKEEMLGYWLKNFNASRRKLVAALREINHRNLAKRLQEKYNVPQTGIQN
jgi:chromosomal replication initiation ATPase DnaA